MALICEKCRRIIMEDVCPFCGSTETREPADDDRAFLITTSDAASAAVLSEFLNQKDIPFRMNTVSIGKYSVIRDFYVPYSRLDEAELEMSRLWKEEQPAGERSIRWNGPTWTVWIWTGSKLIRKRSQKP